MPLPKVTEPLLAVILILPEIVPLPEALPITTEPSMIKGNCSLISVPPPLPSPLLIVKAAPLVIVRLLKVQELSLPVEISFTSPIQLILLEMVMLKTPLLGRSLTIAPKSPFLYPAPPLVVIEPMKVSVVAGSKTILPPPPPPALQ